eukprot:scaffold20938_cov116-Isochrysis_galbana.AAC.2
MKQARGQARSSRDVAVCMLLAGALAQRGNPLAHYGRQHAHGRMVSRQHVRKRDAQQGSSDVKTCAERRDAKTAGGVGSVPGADRGGQQAEPA